jgi:WD40 repeat protein
MLISSDHEVKEKIKEEESTNAALPVKTDSKVESIERNISKLEAFTSILNEGKERTHELVEKLASPKSGSSVSRTPMKIAVSLVSRGVSGFREIAENAHLKKSPSSLEVSSELEHKIDVEAQKQYSHGLLPFVSLLCSSIRSTSRPELKIVALELLYELGKYLSDEVKLSRLVPYFVSIIYSSDRTKRDYTAALIRSSAIKLLTNMLSEITEVQYSDAKIFPEYIFSSLSKLHCDDEELVKITYAQSLSVLAENARRFLDLASFVKPQSDTEVKIYHGNYDRDLARLHDIIWEIVQEIMDKDNSKVKTALLSDLTRLSIFFGRDKVNSRLLPLAITVLNDKDWQLRSTFFENIIGVGIFVGKVTLQDFILPCIEEGLSDAEELVIVRSLESLFSFSNLGLLENFTIEKLSSKVCPLLCHPCAWIRRAALKLIVSVAEQLGPARSHCYLCPKLRHYSIEEIYYINRETLLQLTKSPLSRAAFTKFLKEQLADVDPSKLPFYFNSFIDSYSDSSFSLSSNDEDLKAGLFQYIQAVAKKARQFGGYGNSSDLELVSKFLKLNSEISAHRVAISHTISTALWQELLSEYKEKDYSNVFLHQNGVFGRPKVTGSLLDLLWLRLSDEPDFSLDLSSKPPVDERLKDLSSGTKGALDIPADMPDLGTTYLYRPWLSKSPFYRNHRPFYNYDVSDDKKPTGWIPKGILVADLSEHKSAVNRVSVSRDNIFFVSASDDGTVKIWDAQKLESGIASSQLTYSNQGGKIFDVVVCDSSHSFASVSSDGSIHVVKTAFSFKKDGKHDKYVGNSIVKNISTDEGAALVIDHFNTITESLLVYATQKGIIHVWDLRSKREPFTLTVPAYTGFVTQLSVGPTPFVLLAGTSKGFIILYDMRFRIPVQIWRHSSRSKVTFLSSTECDSLLPDSSSIAHAVSGPLVFCSTLESNEVCAFDLYTGEVRECYKVQIPLKTQIPTQKSTASFSDTKAKDSVKLFRSAFSLPTLSSQLPKDLSFKSIPQDFKDFDYDFSKLSKDVPHMSGMLFQEKDFILTAGSDSVIRYWNLQVEKEDNRPSKRISSPEIDGRIFYKAHIDNSASIIEELIVKDSANFVSDDDEKLKASGNATVGKSGVFSSAKSKKSTRQRGPIEPPSHHLDAITDLKSFEFPQKMLISSSRNGKIKIWV